MRTAIGLITTALMLAIPFAAFATPDGSHEGNGGDGYALEFQQIGRDLGKKLEITTINGMDKNDLARFKTALDQTTVTSTNEPLILNGMEKDAINNPEERTIVFSRLRWIQLDSTLAKQRLVLHEYLGIIGIRDDTAQVSSQLLGPANVSIARMAKVHVRVRRVWNEYTPDNVVTLKWDSVCDLSYDLPVFEMRVPGYGIPHLPDIICPVSFSVAEDPNNPSNLVKKNGSVRVGPQMFLGRSENDLNGAKYFRGYMQAYANGLYGWTGWTEDASIATPLDEGRHIEITLSHSTDPIVPPARRGPDSFRATLSFTD
jgi:hypothetical protein